MSKTGGIGVRDKPHTSSHPTFYHQQETKMKYTMYIVYMIVLLLPNMVMAQTRVAVHPEAQHIKLHNKATGEPIGSITIKGASSYLRDANGEHIKTIVRNADGTVTQYDPSGKIIK